MATDVATPPVNGNYGTQPPYNGTESSATAITGSGSVTSGQNAPTPSTEQSSLSKDEVGWYFVEQYYTTLSRSPEKLHLFHNKKSQFVSGVEAEKVSVAVGQRAIGERIKELDIRDCKVRVLNVDSQESGKDIVIQVIGEMSNKSLPHRKFVQTFVLAEQVNGYYVLNDIFRYIAEDEEEDEEGMETQAVAEQEVENLAETVKSHGLTNSDDAAAQEKDAEIVDSKLEKSTEPVVEQATGATSSSGDTTPEPETTDDTIEQVPETDAETIEEADKAVADESPAPETPQDPEPTPVSKSPKPAEAAPTQAPVQEPAIPPKVAAPKTWASMVAANKAPSPAVPSIPTTTPTQSQPRAPPPAAPAPVAVASANNEDTQGLPSPGGWQTAGQDHGRKQGRQTSSAEGNVLGYIKNVTERVDASLLKGTLTKYGKLAYFDVSRPKNCAFVEFADHAGYSAAVAANPHLIGGEEIYVEERRPRPNAYGGGFAARGSTIRGGRGNLEGRTPSQGGRGNYQKDGNRGGFIPRGRGGSIQPRGRGMTQAA